MGVRRSVFIALIGTLLAATTPAAAASGPAVKGGGFLRDALGKTTLTIAGFDTGLVGDTGQAQFVRHETGSAAHAVHISLFCVNVAGSTAISSGFGNDGRMYLIVVRDNGDDDEFAVIEQVSAYPQCLSGVVPTSGRLGTVDGGNFQVSS